MTEFARGSGHLKPDKPTEKTDKEYSIDLVRFLRRHEAVRYPLNIATRALLIAILVSTKKGRQLLNHPDMRRIIWDREAQVGLLEDSIIAPKLYFPNSDGTSLENRTAVAGRWVGYDFNRPKEFGAVVAKRGKQIHQGELLAFPLDEIIRSDPDIYTPTSLIQPLTAEHLLQLETATIEDLLGYGLIQETTYREAFSRVGLYDRYRLALTLAGLNAEVVYRITPKGNGLVFLAPDFGDEVPELKGKKVLKPAFGI